MGRKEGREERGVEGGGMDGLGVGEGDQPGRGGRRLKAQRPWRHTVAAANEMECLATCLSPTTAVVLPGCWGSGVGWRIVVLSGSKDEALLFFFLTRNSFEVVFFFLSLFLMLLLLLPFFPSPSQLERK